MGVQSKQSNTELLGLAFNFRTEECHVFVVMAKLVISVELQTRCKYYFQ